MIQSLSATFVAALRSVGTAGTMAMAGFYLHRRGYINAEGKKALARLSQQVTIPALFFSKIIYCPQDFSHDKCPDITENLGDVWVLLLWPLFVVGSGLLVGEMAARWSNTPPWQRKSVIAACAFSNSTGLPITLLTVVHANFPATSELGRVDPNLFLSVYLLLYPVLQWGIGGWLLATGEDDDEEIDPALSHRSAVVHHVLNVPEAQNRSTAEAATRMIRELSLSDLLEARGKTRTSSNASTDTNSSAETTSLFQQALESGMQHNNALANPAHDMAPLVETVAKVLPKALQPPVIGALLGLIIASITPLRGLFVDLDTRSSNAPLEWLFDGIHSVGLAAVPINMVILGINLSLTSQKKKGDAEGDIVSRATIFAIVVGKMIVMPAIGIVSALLLKNYVWNIPEDIAAPFYLVLMIVTITPTANNVMVMVELSGSGAKEGMARIIGWQYACAPILLSITVMLVVRVAVLW
jgi:predicted permease